MNNLVYIGPLWGTPDEKETIGEVERIELRCQDLFTGPVNLHLVRRPTWTWCEKPTDEMAKLRPRCEVRDSTHCEWASHCCQLIRVKDSGIYPFVAEQLADNERPTASWRYCRVRLDAQGQVLVDWEGDE